MAWASRSSGAVTALQRVSSDLRLNPHFHSIALDGVFVSSERGEPEFHSLPQLDTADVADLMQVIRVRILRHLVKAGVIDNACELTVLEGEPCRHRERWRRSGRRSQRGPHRLEQESHGPLLFRAALHPHRRTVPDSPPPTVRRSRSNRFRARRGICTIGLMHVVVTGASSGIGRDLARAFDVTASGAVRGRHLHRAACVAQTPHARQCGPSRRTR